MDDFERRANQLEAAQIERYENTTPEEKKTFFDSDFERNVDLRIKCCRRDSTTISILSI